MNFSIKTKITIWYVACFATAIFFMLLLTGLVLTNETKIHITELVTNTVEDSAYDIEYENNMLDIYDDDIPFFRDGIYVAIYNGEGQQLGGYSPGVMEHAEFASGAARELEIENETWIVYDKNVNVENYGEIWVKGCVSLTQAIADAQNFLTTEIIIFPILLVIAVTGGMVIAKRAFRPVKIMAETAENTVSGKDLKKRIPLGKSKDELYSLAETFNHMFERLDTVFENEKRFTSDVSHELRTPVAVIANEAEYALENPSEEKESLLIIKEQAQEMKKLINMLLMLSRADSGKITPEKDIFNFSELAEIIAEMTEESAAKRNITIHTDIESDIEISADRVMITSMMMNLAENAVKYGKKGGNIWLALKKTPHGAAGSVRDDGNGIEEKNLELIWQRFFREKDVRNKEGSGLGLPIAKWIAENHGGNIIVESEKGSGTTFRFFIPFS